MKKRITGTVVSDSMDKTRVIEVVRAVLHPIYKKRYRVSKRFYAHDPGNRTKVGDVVTIEETRPLSKLKRWLIVDREKEGDTPSSVPAQAEKTETAIHAPSGKRSKGTRRSSTRGKT